jgi:hypothetical protein
LRALRREKAQGLIEQSVLALSSLNLDAAAVYKHIHLTVSHFLTKQVLSSTLLRSCIALRAYRNKRKHQHVVHIVGRSSVLLLILLYDYDLLRIFGYGRALEWALTVLFFFWRVTQHIYI